MSSWPDAAIAELAARRQTIVSYQQLRALDISSSAIDRAHRRGRLRRVHRGVYSLVPTAARPARWAEHAAILATGPHAVVSHLSAAHLHGLLPRATDPRVHVTVRGTHRHDRPGLAVHRTRDLPPAERHRLDGIPVTSVARTVVDLAPALNPPGLAALVDRALKRTSRTKLTAAVRRRPYRSGVPVLALLLDPTRPSADVWSPAEDDLLERIRRSGLPLPEANVPVGPYVPDLTWREQRVIVDYDSAAHHSGPAAQRWDTARHNDLTARYGYDVIHVTGEELTEHPERLLVQIAQALTRAPR